MCLSFGQAWEEKPTHKANVNMCDITAVRTSLRCRAGWACWLRRRPGNSRSDGGQRCQWGNRTRPCRWHPAVWALRRTAAFSSPLRSSSRHTPICGGTRPNICSGNPDEGLLCFLRSGGDLDVHKTEAGSCYNGRLSATLSIRETSVSVFLTSSTYLASLPSLYVRPQGCLCFCSGQTSGSHRVKDPSISSPSAQAGSLSRQ